MKVFIVGIAGGVGSRLARLLTAAGDQVDGLYRRPEQGERLAAEGIHATYGDLTRLDATALADLVHTPQIRLQILELVQGVRTHRRRRPPTDPHLTGAHGFGVR